MRLADEIDMINNQSKRIADIRKEIEKDMENMSEVDKLYEAAHKDYEDRKLEAIKKLYEVIEFLKEREI